MQITIKINVDNAAFEDNPNELADILASIPERTQHHSGNLYGACEGIVRDSNGNKCGIFIVERTEP